jgi:hypothetical protein
MFVLVGFLVFGFIGMTMINRMLEGAMIASQEIVIINNLTITHDQTIFGLFEVPVLNADFFFTGIPRLVKWDYGFFGGNAQIMQYLLYSLTFAVSFMLFILIAGMVFQFFSRR